MYSPELKLNGQILVKMFRIQKNILEHLKKQYYMLFFKFCKLRSWLWKCVLINLFVVFQNVLPQIFDEGATEDRGEMARMVSNTSLFRFGEHTGIFPIKWLINAITRNLKKWRSYSERANIFALDDSWEHRLFYQIFLVNFYIRILVNIWYSLFSNLSLAQSLLQI